MPDALDKLRLALERRFADPPVAPDLANGLETLAGMAGRGAQRAFTAQPLDQGLVRLLCAVALASPTKSDLQQRDILRISDPDLRQAVNGLIEAQAWIADAPELLIFCGNNRRQRQLHAWRGRPFVNDHLDAFFNAAVDAAIALGAFVTAAEAVGLGCCPVSAVRNEAQRLSELLELPDHVFPVAGLALGWPAGPAEISQRLPLAVTLHENRFGSANPRSAVEAYDRARTATQPYAKQRFTKDYGEDPDYGWSEDKARQYSKPERADFGAFIRAKGFKLD
ncbi:MAG: nitroreductase family protein [Kiloniellales bacterium]|nr:nitroreductase family protein [Kiloniellales bacterium]